MSMREENTRNSGDDYHEILSNVDGHANNVFESSHVECERSQLGLGFFIWLIRKVTKFLVY